MYTKVQKAQPEEERKGIPVDVIGSLIANIGIAMFAISKMKMDWLTITIIVIWGIAYSVLGWSMYDFYVNDRN